MTAPTIRPSGGKPMLSPGPLFAVRATNSSAVHDQPAIDAEGLTRHVFRARRYEEPDQMGDVLRTLHASQRHLANALSRKLFGRLLEQRSLLAGDGGPHVG